MARHATNLAERPLTALDVIYSRRSVRAYTGQALEQSTVRALLDASVQAPTAMQGQPWVFAVVQDPRALRWLSDRVKSAWIEKSVPTPGCPTESGLQLHGACTDRLQDPDFDIFHGAGTLVVIGARSTEPFVAGDCWLAAGTLMLAAAALGLGACCIGAAVSVLNQPDVKAELGIPVDVHTVASVVVGVPKGALTPVPRREPEIVAWK